MADLLFLAHRIPYPPNKGDKIRSWHILRHLAERHRVHLGCFIDDPADRQHEQVLRDVCASCRFVELSPRAAKLRSLRGLLTGEPLTLPYYASRALAAWVESVVREHRPGRFFFYSSAMAQFDVATSYPARRVMDLVDVDSQKWAEYATRQRWPLSWIYAREGRSLLEFERAVAARMDANILVSDAEAKLFAQLAPAARDRIHAVNNGVDTEYFSPERGYDNPFPPGAVPLVFTGAMDYWPNIDAVEFFAREVLPSVRSRIRDAGFWIVGSNPADSVKALGRTEGVVVTGRVPDIRPYIAHAASVVAPLRIARGVQNKVLEAMSMAKTVIASPAAAEGIPAADGREFLVAGDPEAFSKALINFIEKSKPGDLGKAARAYILATYDWQKSLYKLDGILDGAPVTADAEPGGPGLPRRQTEGTRR